MHAHEVATVDRPTELQVESTDRGHDDVVRPSSATSFPDTHAATASPPPWATTTAAAFASVAAMASRAGRRVRAGEVRLAVDLHDLARERIR